MFEASILKLPFTVKDGPSDDRVQICGMPHVRSNIPGQSSFLVNENCHEQTDAVHTFAVVR